MAGGAGGLAVAARGVGMAGACRVRKLPFSRQKLIVSRHSGACERTAVSPMKRRARAGCRSWGFKWEGARVRERPRERRTDDDDEGDGSRERRVEALGVADEARVVDGIVVEARLRGEAIVSNLEPS